MGAFALRAYLALALAAAPLSCAVEAEPDAPQVTSDGVIPQAAPFATGASFDPPRVAPPPEEVEAPRRPRLPASPFAPAPDEAPEEPSPSLAPRKGLAL
jgi:hypothetical protein